jgi:hypothetical protein
VIRSIAAFTLALAFVPFAALADDVGSDEVIQIQQEEAVVVEETQPVTAPPPPYVEIESMAIAAGIGARFGGGVLLVAGEEHPFTMKGLSLGDLGVSRIDAEGSVANLEDVSDFAGRYVAVEAGAAAGKGVSTLTMRNEKGVVITLESTLTGAQLTLGGQALEIELQ